MTRCPSKCPRPTPWSQAADWKTGVPEWANHKTRCTLDKGHKGPHRGCDDSEGGSE